jgi:signal transduction histidine kinase
LPLLLLAVLGIRGIQRGRESTLEKARAAADRAVENAAQRFQEVIAVRLTEARPVKLYAFVPQPAESTEIEALYHRAVAGPAEEAETTFAMILKDHPEAVTAAGLPLRALIQWTRLQRCGDDATRCALQAEVLARVAVDESPSLISGKLIEATTTLLQERGANADSLRPWRERWEEDEQIRRALRRASDGNTTPVRHWADTHDGSQRWWLEPQAGGTWRALTEEQLKKLARDIASETAALLPRSAQLSVVWADHELLASSTGERLAARQVEPLSIAAILANPDDLFAEQRQQTIWLAALLGIALLAVLGAFLAMQRALITERQLNQQKSDFVASVSHELRTPVSSMRLMLENLESGAVETDSARRNYLQLLGSECHRLSALIENVLDFARIEHDRKIYHMAEADVAAMIHDAVELMQPHAAQRRQKLIANVEPIEPAPQIDALALQQAVINLIDNAMKFSPPDTSITVSTRRRDERTWQLCVADQGPGIPESEHARIFERFYRIGNELRRETQGAGIGLAIVKHTVDAHGGRIEVDSQPGQGATFVLILPYTQEPN